MRGLALPETFEDDVELLDHGLGTDDLVEEDIRELAAILRVLDLGVAVLDVGGLGAAELPSLKPEPPSSL